MGIEYQSNNHEAFVLLCCFRSCSCRLRLSWKQKNTIIDKGPRECGGSKANDSGKLTFKCRSRAKKNTKHCKATCPKGMKVDVGGQPTTRKIRCSKVRKGLTMAWVSKQYTDSDKEINPNLFKC